MENTKTYKLLKELPGIDIGDTVEIQGGNNTPYTWILVDGNAKIQIYTPEFEWEESEWFEKVVPEKPKTIWDLKERDPFYYRNGDSIVSSDWHNDERDIGIREAMEIFLSREDLLVSIEITKARNKIKKFIHENGMEFEPNWDDESQSKYSIIYIHGRKYFEVDKNKILGDAKILPYFKSEEDAEKIIKNFPDQLKLIFNI